MRIMYVEDNAINLGLVRRIAKMGNHEVISHANGPDALKSLETEDVDLILMDIELEGEMDGIEVVKKLRERGDKRPIVAVTAYAMVGDKDRILAAGCNGYLPKPLPVAQFLQILAKYDPVNAPRSTQEMKTATPIKSAPDPEATPNEATSTKLSDATAPTSPNTTSPPTGSEPNVSVASEPSEATTPSKADSTTSAKTETVTTSESMSTPTEPTGTDSSSSATPSTTPASEEEKPLTDQTEEASNTPTTATSSSALPDRPASNVSEASTPTPNKQE